MASDEKEVRMMLLRKDEDTILGNDVFGRMSVDMDESEFDALPKNEFDLTEDDVKDAELFSGDGEPAPFVQPVDPFPVFRQSLRKFQDAQPKKQVARIDTDDSYGQFVCEKAVAEIQRQLDVLRDAFEQHVQGGGEDVLGAAETISNLQAASTPQEAAAAMPQIPVDLPAFAEGKVKCWRDGATVVCSMRFGTSDGQSRYATMAAKPKVNMDDVYGCACQAGLDPVTVLGILPDLAAKAQAKRLIRDTARAALKARKHSEVLGMQEPLLLASRGGDMGTAARAALMDLQQKSDHGHAGARSELTRLQGVDFVRPILADAQKRLGQGRAQKQSYIQRYVKMLESL